METIRARGTNKTGVCTERKSGSDTRGRKWRQNKTGSENKTARHTKPWNWSFSSWHKDCGNLQSIMLHVTVWKTPLIVGCLCGPSKSCKYKRQRFNLDAVTPTKEQDKGRNSERTGERVETAHRAEELDRRDELLTSRPRKENRRWKYDSLGLYKRHSSQQ